MAKLIHPFAINKLPRHVHEIDHLSFLLGNYRVPIPAKARQLILERAFNADKRADDRRKGKGRLSRRMSSIRSVGGPRD